MQPSEASPQASPTRDKLAVAFVVFGQLGAGFFAAMPLLPCPGNLPGVNVSAAVLANLLAAALLFTVSVLLGKITRMSRAVLVPLLSLATFWHWLLIMAFVFSGGAPHGSDWLAFLPLPIAFVLSFVGITIGRDIAARKCAPARPAP